MWQTRAQAAQSYRVEHGLHAGIVRLAQQQQRQADVLRHIEMRQHMKGLKHKPGLFPAQARLLVVVQAAQINAVEQHRARVPVVEPGHAVEQGGFADTGLTHNGDKFACGHTQRDLAEHRHLAVVLA